jgi:predicted acyltransferase (DUF342 family)
MSKWLDLSNSANKIRQTYVQGFLDVSGGGIYLRNDMSLNFYDKSNSAIPKFSIKSDSMRIPDRFGVYYDMSISQLLYLNNLSTNIDSQFSNLVNRTKYITSDTSNIDTIIEIDGGVNKKIIVNADIVPSAAYAYNLGTPTVPFGSLYVKQGTIHFVDEATNNLAASISYDPSYGSLDLSTNGIVSSLNNTRVVNGKLQTPLLSYGGNVGIGVTNPTHALDVSGNVNIAGNSSITGNLSINRGDVTMDGNLIIGSTIYEQGVPLSTKYLSVAEPTINGTATMQKALIKVDLTVLGDSSLNGRLFVGGDVSMNANVVVLGNLYANTTSISDNSTLVATTQYVKNQGYATSANPILTGTTNMVTGIVAQKFVVGGDVSLNSKLSVFSSATFNNRLFVNNDATFNTKVLVLGDSSLNGNVSIGGNLLVNASPASTDNSNKVATTQYVQSQNYAKLSGANFLGDVSMSSRLFVSGDLSLNGKLSLGSDAFINGNIITITQANADNSNKVATTAYVQNQGYATLASPSFTGTTTLQGVSIYQNLLVSSDSTFIGNLSVNGNMVAITQFNSDSSTKVATTQFVKNQGYATIASPTFTGSVVIPTLSISKNLFTVGDSSFNGRLFISNDVSLNGNMNIGGLLTINTPASNDNSNKVATTAYVQSQNYAKLSGANFTGDISLNTKLLVGGDVSFNKNMTVYGNTNLLGNSRAVTQLDIDNSTLIATTAYVKSQGYSTIDSPEFTGIPKAPTPQYGDSSTQIATTEFVINELFSFINSNEQVYNALQQLSSALSNTDASFATTLAQSLGLKADRESPIFTGLLTTPYLNVLNNLYSLGDVSFNNKLYVGGDVSINGNLYSVTQPVEDISTKVATTEFIKNQGYAKLSGANFSGLVTASQGVHIDGNANLSNNLNLIGDSSMNGNLKVGGKMVVNDLITIIKNMIIQGDLSLNGNLNVGGFATALTQLASDNSTKIATTQYVQNQGYAKLTGANFTGDISLNTKLSVGTDALINGKLVVGSDSSMNGNINIGGNLTLNKDLIVDSDTSLNGNLMVGNVIYENGLSLISKYATLASPTFTGVVSGITKSMIDLSNVDNTSDVNKPVSTAQQTALNLKANIASPTFTGSVSVPIINISQSAFINGDASMNGRLFITKDLSLNGNMNIGGLLTAVTPLTTDNSKKVATTEYVQSQNYISSTGGNFIGAVSFKSDLSIDGDLSLNGRLFTNGDASLNSNIFIGNNATIIKDLSLGGNLLIGKSVSMNNGASIKGDLSLNGNLNMDGILTVRTSLLNDSSYKVATTEFVKKQGFALLSGANFTGDVSMNNNLLVVGDTSINGNTLIVGDVSMNNGLLIGGDVSMNNNLLVKGKTTLLGDVNINNSILIGNNAAIIGNLSISKDLSLNGNLNIDGSLKTITQSNADNSTKVATTAFVKNQGYATIASPSFTGTATATTLIVTQNLISNSDVYMQNNLNVTNDGAIGGNLNVTGLITSVTPSINENSTTVATTAYVKSQPFAPLNSPTFTGKLQASNIDISNNLVVLGDSSMNGNLNINGKLSAVTPVTSDNSTTVATTAYVKSQPFAPLNSPTFTGKLQASNIDISNNLVVLGDSSMNGNLMVGNVIYENGLSLISKYATLASPTFTGIVSGITKSMVDLSNVDNTSDINKPVSTAQQTALNLKANIASPTFTGTLKTSYIDISYNMVVRGDASMNGNINIGGILTTLVPSISDNSNRVATTSYVQSQNYAKLSGSNFTGDVSMNGNLIVYGNTTLAGITTATTPIASDNSTRVATTAFVQNLGFASLTSPAFTGVPTAPTVSVSLPTTNQVATTLYVENKISDFFNTASQSTLSAINQLSQALSATDASFATAIANQLKIKADIESPTFTGVVSMPNTTISQNASIGGDLSLNGNVNTGGLIYEQGIALVNRYATLVSPTFTGTVGGITKTMVGLSNVDNTADIYKPVSTAQQTALNLKANIASPNFTGFTKMVYSDISSGLHVGGDVSFNSNLLVSGTIYENSLPLTATYATLASPTFTGIVRGIDASMVGLGNVNNTADINKPVSIAQQEALILKANLASPNFTGIVSIGGDLSVNGNIITVTPALSDNSNKVATTAFVKSQNAGYAQLTGANFSGDISLNARLIVAKDTSLNGNLFVAGNIVGNYPINSIPLSAVIGGLGTNVDLSTNQTVYGIKTFMNDVSMNSRLFLGGDITVAGNNITSSLYQQAVDASSTTISNLIKVTNNYNGNFINQFEISKLNGAIMTYNTTSGIPNISLNGGQTWKQMVTTGSNNLFNAMVCMSPDGRIILKQEYNSSTSAPSLYISNNWGDSYTSISIAQPYIYNNARYGYNTYNDQAYAFSQDGTVLYFIGYDINNTFSLWKNSDTSFNSFIKQGSSWNYSLSNCPRAIATSGNGQYLLAITGIIPANGMYLYQSSNFGTSFTKTATGLNTTWNSIAVSHSGKYQSATDNNRIYQSSDFGITWSSSSSAPTAKWNFISMSNDGKNRIACIDSSYQYISIDYGISWSVIPNSFGNWKKAVMLDLSGSNSIMIYSHDGINIYKNYYKAEDVLQKTTISSDLNITTPYHYLNTIGKSINLIKSNIFNNYNGTKAGISSTGQYIVLPIASQQCIMSQDYGSSWNYLPGLTSQIDYKYAVVSGNGKYMFIRNGYVTYWSSNYGSTWSLFTAVQSSDDTNGIAISYTGQYMVYVGLETNNNSSVYISSNYGSTWSLSTTFPVTNTHFSASISTTGQYISILSSNSYLITSNDYGVTWNIINTLLNCSQVCISANGKYQTVISSSSIFSSSNYGLNFTCVYNSVPSPGFTALTMIGSGEYQYVVNSYTNQLLCSNDYGITWNVLYTNSISPKNTVVSTDGTVMLYSTSGDIYISRVADNAGSINSTAISISRKGIISSLDLSLNGSISTQNLIVDKIYENGNLLAAKYATINSPAFTGIVSGITKSMIDLSNVDNTSDMNKPVSTAQQTALNLKANSNSPNLTGLTTIQSSSIINSLFVGGDVSMNSRLFIAGDVSLNGNLYANYAPNTIPINAIQGGIPSATGIFSYDISANLKLFVNGDVSLNSILTVQGDTILKNRLFVTNDSTLYGNLILNKDASFNKNLSINGNIIALKSLNIGGDASMNGNLYIAQSIYENGQSLISKYATLETPTFSGIATFDKIHITEDLLVNSDATIDGNLTITRNLNTNANIYGNHLYEGNTSLINKYATLESPTFTGTVSGISSTMVGLGNVDNTSDMNKPISTAQQTALNLKANSISPIFTGIPLAPTPNTGTNTSQIATTAYVRGEIYNLVGSAPETLNTLQELAAAINSDASFASTVSSQLATKASITNPSFNGIVNMPNLNVTNNSIISGDVSMNDHLYVGADASFGGNLFVAGALKLNSDFAINNNLSIGGDLSVNGFITGNYPNNSIPSTAISDIRNQYGTFQFSAQRADVVSFDEDHFELTRSSGDGAYVETLYSYNSDLSLNGNLRIHGTGASIFSNDVSVDSNLLVNNNSLIQGNLFVGQDVSLNNNLDLSGSLIAHNNVNVYGIINQYTLSLEDGYKVDYETDKQKIEALQVQVASLQGQITSILQILARNNLS